MLKDAGKPIIPPPATTASCSSDQYLPWLWVIESLSDSNLVDPSLLQDLINKGSELTTHDSFIEIAKERLALNHLEDLLSGPSKSAAVAAASNLESQPNKVGIDVTSRAQDVLRLVLDNLETSNMRMTKLDSLKWDVRQFILHKRTGLPKFDLQQLKIAILEGVDPSASLLREVTGLGKEDQQVKIPDDVDVSNTAILENINSSANCLRQRSELEKVDQQDNRILVDCVDPTTAADNRDENLNNLEIQSPEENSCHLDPENGNQLLQRDSCGKDQISLRKVLPEQNHNQRLNERRMGLGSVNNVAEGLEQNPEDDEVHSKSQNSAPLPPANTNEIVQEHPTGPQGHRILLNGGDPNTAADRDENMNNPEIQSQKEAPGNGKQLFSPANTSETFHSLLSRKKERSCFSEKEQMQSVGKGTVSGDNGDHQPGSRNLNNGELKSLEQNSTSLRRKEPVQDPSGRKLSSVDKEVSDLAKGTLVHDLQGDGNLMDDYECVPLKRLKQSINDNQIQYNQLHCPSSDGVIPEETNLNGPHQNSHVIESKVDRKCCTQPGTSSGYDRNLDKAPNFDSDEEMVVAAEKHSFLSSQNTFNQDSQATAGRTEGSICMKCNEGGQLLTCSISSCSLAVHESCVGSSYSVHDSGKFYCPFCSYVQAIAAYRETKRKATLVKKKVATARNHLSDFMSVVNSQRQPQSSERAPSEELISEIHGRRLQRIVNNQPMQAEVALECINSSPPSRGAPTSPSRNAAKARGEDHQKQVIDHENHRVVEKQELADPCTAHDSDDLPQKVEKTTLNCKNTLPVLLSGEREKAVRNEDQPSVSKERDHAKAHKKGKTVKSSSTHAGTASVRQQHADVEKEIEDCKYTADPHGSPSCQRNVNPGEGEENQDDHRVFRACRRRPRLSTQYSNCERRKRTAWTVEEEEILKEGVFIYTSGDGKTIQWKKILEFGSHVFLNSRTTIDLKDKWRNIWDKRGGRRT